MRKSVLLCLLLLFGGHVVAQVQEKIASELVTLNVLTGEERILLRQNRHFEAPNWSREGDYLLINSGGLLEKIDLSGRSLGRVQEGVISTVNNDHGLSFDGKILVYSKNEKGLGSRIYTVPLEGGIPKLITPNYPSYWHGISPDGSYLVYCAQREGKWDVYRVPTLGGEEVRLTTEEGLDDGPEYSYDGQWIYFNSHRTGRMHLYRMKADGSSPEQLTFDAYDNWFPHPSPDNQTLVYISYLEDQKGSHPFGKEVKLRLFDLNTRQSTDLTPVFFGGQGTINVHSWSRDGQWIAYVRYYKEN
jgi:Tol biopolymer transport system component